MWKKKYPGLAGLVGTPTEGQTGPSVAPVGEPQPAFAARSMNHDLAAQAVPSQLPAVPKLTAQPNMNENEIKKRALTNIAMGRKGF